MLKYLDSDSDTKVGLMRSGRPFREVPLANLFKKNYGDEGFYSGEEVELTDEENSDSTRMKEVGSEELHQGETETSGTVPTIEVSIVIPTLVLEAISNHSNQSSQSSQSTVTISFIHTQSRNQGRYMEDEMRLIIFKGDRSEDPNQH
jgi:hypothetical protein